MAKKKVKEPPRPQIQLVREDIPLILKILIGIALVSYAAIPIITLINEIITYCKV